MMKAKAWPSVEITGRERETIISILCTNISVILLICFSHHDLRLVWNTGLGDYTRVLMSQLGAMASGILCLSALGVPYAGGELARRGFGPTTCPLFT